jgi:hypothetical protein
MARTRSMPCDSGSTWPTICTAGGSESRGKNTPDRNIIGVITSVK